ncbi:TIGR03619 family F420-dependent LLM class oxidoreductase [Iamia majanohamensis]|uniref:TIGR03619 family F420-dependent LLM class oxidoreductase n=1 Tax=Iamia majanohamensis TaxID=467976 RepID=A0AAE9YA33_9ACTN|nr:TIGR03619 family F420-dependent LLM class oxidoreductase [Iamia majanohamensis]WCO67338.1 TIGR03619 family F420-dependent LLM class oxidoreductase [Iamia majanohamensis]
MRLGLTTGFGTVGPPDDVAALVAHAEAVGFDSVWLTEHVVVPVDHAPRYPYTDDGRLPIGAGADLPDPLTWLAFAAAHTRRLLLGTGCLVLPQRNPVVLAKEAATVDRLSGGRLRLGVGLGWMREEAEAVGSAWEDRADRVEEGIALLRDLWSPGPSALPGGPALSLPAPSAGTVPIVVCGPSRAAARRAGRVGDGYLCGHRDPEVVADRLAALRAAATDAGRDPDGIEVTVGATPRLRTLEAMAALGVHRAFVTLPCRGAERDRAALDRLAPLVEAAAAL